MQFQWIPYIFAYRSHSHIRRTHNLGPDIRDWWHLTYIDWFAPDCCFFSPHTWFECDIFIHYENHLWPRYCISDLFYLSDFWNLVTYPKIRSAHQRPLMHNPMRFNQQCCQWLTAKLPEKCITPENRLANFFRKLCKAKNWLYAAMLYWLYLHIKSK